MSAETSFDTHRFVKNLTAAGFTERQAETLAKEQIRLIEGNLATRVDVATVKSDLEIQIQQVKSDLEVQIRKVKSDLEVQIQQVKSDLEVQIQSVKSDLEVQIQSVKSDLMKWMVGAMTAQTGLLVGLILGLPRLF